MLSSTQSSVHPQLPRIPIKRQPHPLRRIRADLAVFEDADAVDERAFDGAPEGMAFEG